MGVLIKCFPVYEYGYTHCKSQGPNANTDKEGPSHLAMILAPDRPVYHQTAVQANGSEQENAGKHVEDDDGGDELTQEEAIGPVSPENHVNQREGQGQAAEEISQRQVEKPNRVHRALHLQAGYPQHQPVARQPQEKGETENEHGENFTGAIRSP